MDINVLVVNVGNSRLSLGAFVAGELQAVQRVSLEQRADWPGIIEQLWSKHLKGREGATVAGASVNPPVLEVVEHAVMQATQQPVQWVGKDLDVPIKILTEEPEQTGIDRVLGVAAAYEQMGKACVVVDAGTAITVNCCNDEGDFLGGAIAPGAAIMLDALHNRTAKLPRAPLAVPRGAFGRTTESAIQQGIYHGIRGMVKELVENFATELGTWPDIIATGGDAPLLFEGWELIHAVAPDLTLYGIALAYAEHHIKHGT
ncbi:MAG TPA: type III pantothenate kinase [Tepidisphaeraceae bacterium]|jgi:type III pantothenate kinase